MIPNEQHCLRNVQRHNGYGNASNFNLFVQSHAVVWYRMRAQISTGILKKARTMPSGDSADPCDRKTAYHCTQT